MTEVAELKETFVPTFEAFRRHAAFGAGALAKARETAFARFAERGIPTTRDEEWRFTSMTPVVRAGFEPTPGAHHDATAHLDGRKLAPWLFGGTLPYRVIVVNGRWLPQLSSPEWPSGVRVRGLRDSALPDIAWHRPTGHAFADLNTAFFDDAVIIEISPRAVVTDPIHVLHVLAGDGKVMASPRLVVIAGEQCQVPIVESYVGGGTSFSNAVTDIRVGAGAVVDHVKFQRQTTSTFHVGTMFADLGRAATMKSHAITLGSHIARNDIIAVLDGEGAECTLNGLYVAGGESLVDTHTTIDHAKAHCPSHEVYKGILTGHARAVFNGKIIVRPDAQKTDAKQTNKALLLTDDAQINTKPQLEIFADDVKCTHGAAIGQLDEDALFYLRARGVGLIEARNMLIHAFAGDVLNGVVETSVRETAMRLVEETLEKQA
jgi:Fe-S cluster assembly protein SufD